jgi:hypothetical protein
MATHIGYCADITKGMTVEIDPEDDLYYVYVLADCNCGCPNCKGKIKRKHNGSINKVGQEEPDEMIEWLEGLQESYDEDFERYQEENHYEIVQMERYEQWRNEY